MSKGVFLLAKRLLASKNKITNKPKTSQKQAREAAINAKNAPKSTNTTNIKKELLDTSAKQILSRLEKSSSTKENIQENGIKNRAKTLTKDTKKIEKFETKKDKQAPQKQRAKTEESKKDSNKKIDEKDALLIENTDQDSEQNISFSQLMLVFLAIFIALVVLLPKVYISNQIYYLSREVSELNSKKDVLLEERSLLSSKIEEISYKQQILPMVNQNVK